MENEEKNKENDKVDEENEEENEEILSSDESEEVEDEDSPEDNEEENENPKNGNKYFFRFVAITAILLFAVVLFKFSPDAQFATSNVIAEGISAKAAADDSQSAPAQASGGNGEVQVVKMFVRNGQYIMEPNTFRAGSKVRIEADVSRIPGCAKSIMIPAFNIKKSLTPSNNVIEFTPNKAGTFNIACSMNMYKGTFIVLEADGSKSNYVEKANTAAASCGAGGGCGGCGG